ncbi:glycoside hydrolase family 18 protein [Dyella sp.]|uniref:glycoside hydrolase family 18 protein n=1 Tax=Dyella sp. TaxID=1869338 RepID=UPI002ED4DB44
MLRNRLNRMALLLALLLASLWLMPFGASAGDYRIVGYVSDAQPLPAISPDKIDVINFAFAKVSPQGEAVLESPTAPVSLADLTALRKRNPSLRIVLSVGGWGAGHFSEAALDDASRQRFTRSALALIEKYNLDGVDLDWEYPTLAGPGISHRPDDRRHFSLLLEKLRASLDKLGHEHQGRHYLLTIAAADSEFVAGIELKRVGRTLDWFNLMTYDFHTSLTPTTGHHAGLFHSQWTPADDRSGDKAVQQFLAAGVPAKKLNLGVAFYGRAFAGVTAEHDGVQQPYTQFIGAPSWDELNAQYIDKQGYVRHWDAKAQAPWLWNAQTHTFISYEDPQSLAAKTAYVKSHGLGGVMYWEQSLDSKQQLLDVLVKGLRGP